ncbi:NAD(P)H-dependent glycerol-3-phosphate dehydrogenase [Plantactinospora sp. KLBMP9567]|uniref:NAD(P)H-dependent glycerol-3-phosphate dehydrogenase n=1 Tax=Plantactinospora sp. KLBMP9567 TaxID=3085900 RepID=UPI002981C25F|nr:NAD(P)H-dependent glycerol-3-phosphate dehydrogenase [Plantactinospora sp. KLBMP9567]MDW5325858.1 NAD(P)H-dependent glycerol-3-phosphate dehydrogenase [Plantactinospora sp. KLBMP9567]
MTTRMAVFGAGSWGTAFAMILADAGCRVTLWGRRPDLVDAVNRTGTNPDYFPGIPLPAGITATADPAEAAEGAEFVVLAVPSQTLRANLTAWTPLIAADSVLVSLMKGVELGTAKLMSQVVAEVTGAGPDRVAVVSGPNLAPEIVRRQPAASVVACRDEAVARRLQTACHTGYYRPYTNTDVIGCEIGGAVKNVIGLAVGIAGGLGLGDNTKASLITRGLAETTRLGLAMGADPLSFAGLAGMGDLVATCSSPLSRNQTFGTNLGRGMTVAETVAATRQTAEGVTSCQSVLDLARRHDVDMPIAEMVVDIVRGGKSPQVAVKELMARSAKPERR